MLFGGFDQEVAVEKGPRVYELLENQFEQLKNRPFLVCKAPFKFLDAYQKEDYARFFWSGKKKQPNYTMQFLLLIWTLFIRWFGDWKNESGKLRFGK